MKAAQISEYGGTSIIKINQKAKPGAGKGQVLVEVKASSLNPFDTKLREGQMKDFIKLKFPATLGGDVAGVVVEVGEDVKGFAPGEQVYGQAYVMSGSSGAFAEFAAVKASQLAKAPANLDFKQSASLVLVGVSALQALTEHINLKSGQKILIHGGSGGIGSIAIQIAKHIGAYVATTAPGETIDQVKQLGADEVIDYKTEDFTTRGHDYDAVFDTVGGEVFEKSWGVLKPGGTAVSMVSGSDLEAAKEFGVVAINQSTEVNAERLDKLTQLIELDVIKPQIAKVFPLEQIKAAFDYRETQSFAGKVVIELG